LATPETLSVTAAQRQELDRRIEIYQQSHEASIPWSEAKKRICATAS
jgi:putative addiction module component (TIGR02574 family)